MFEETDQLAVFPVLKGEPGRSHPKVQRIPEKRRKVSARQAAVPTVRVDCG